MSTEKHTQGRKLENKKAVLRPDLIGERLVGHIPIDIGNHGEAALVVWKMEDDDRSPECEEMARRLVACWNAFDGPMTTEMIETIPKPVHAMLNEDMKLVRCLREQRDELLAALEYALDCHARGDTSDMQPVRDAIANVKGGAA